MKESNGTYTASLPTDKTGDMFYYIEVKTDKETPYQAVHQVRADRAEY